MTPDQQLILWIGAFRYYRGRMTYAVGDFCVLLIQEWPTIPDDARKIIWGELMEAFAADERSRANGETFGPLGHDCDRAEWEKVLAAMEGKK